MTPETFAENVKSEAEKRSIQLIPIASHRTEGFRVEPEDLSALAEFAEERNLPFLLYEDLNPEKSEGSTLPPTRYARLYVKDRDMTFHILVSSK